VFLLGGIVLVWVLEYLLLLAFGFVQNSLWIGVLRLACLVCVADAEYPLALGDCIKIKKRCKPINRTPGLVVKEDPLHCVHKKKRLKRSH